MGIVRNAARCDECGDEIESKHRHDFVLCACQALHVDGGRAYLKRGVMPGAAWTELSEFDDPAIAPFFARGGEA